MPRLPAVYGGCSADGPLRSTRIREPIPENVLCVSATQNHVREGFLMLEDKDFDTGGDTASPKPMPDCDHCGAHVSERFARVFADEGGYVHACPSCSANAGIAEVARQRARRA